MRTERVFTNMTCNQNCTYCTSRAVSEDRAFVQPSAVRARISDALAQGAQEIVLTGGEPTLRKDVPALVAHAKQAGAQSVVLETNATALDGTRALALREAGLNRARVNLSGADARLDAVTRDEGGFERALAGVLALRAAEVPVELAVTLVRSTLHLVAEIPSLLAARLGETSGLTGIVVTVPVTAPDASEVLQYDEARVALQALDASAKKVGISVRLSADVRPPPCVFPANARAPHLYSMTRGATKRSGHVQVDACGRCQVNDRCSGIPDEYLAQFPVPELFPITDDRTRRRLSIASTVQEQVAHEFVSPNRTEKIPGQPVYEEIIRINFHCNQACRFCFVSTHLPPPGDEAVRSAILSATARGAKVMISGGEPTLNPRLPEYIRLAKTHGQLPVFMESNAVRLADPALAKTVVDAGLAEVFISLHGATAEVSDAITEAPGTFAKTVVGIDNMVALGVQVILNFVICRRNYTQIPEYVRFVADRWPGVLLNISFIAPSQDVVPQDRQLVPRYSEARLYLAEGLQLARTRGLRVNNMENMCGLPLCLVPVPNEEVFALSDIPEGFDRGEFVRSEACRSCALQKKCYGMRRGYADIYGTEELQALPPR